VNRYLLCCGDATSLATWSNIPYFLLRSGVQQGLLQGGLDFRPEKLQMQRQFWNLKQFITTGKFGGFQYSNNFIRALLRQIQMPSDQSLSFLSHFPFLPSYPWSPSWTVDFYIDATTHQVFSEYGTGARLSSAYCDEILQREKLAFNNANLILCMSQWVAESVINDYGIDSKIVHVVPAGANLDESQLEKYMVLSDPQPPSAIEPLRLGFLGKEWSRKGGPFLLRLAETLMDLGTPTQIRAIGPDPRQLPKHPALHALGFINKQTETNKFVAEVQTWHFGTLFSTAEAFGISNRECLRLGVPVLTHAVGGIPSTIPDQGCGNLFEAYPCSKNVANWILQKLHNYQNYLDWRHSLSYRFREFTWDYTVEKLKSVLT